MLFPDARILLFAKAPVPGYVKTRLIPAMGEQGAAQLYARLLSNSLAALDAAGIAPVECWCAPDQGNDYFVDLAERHEVQLFSQCEGDLGERMAHAARQALSKSSQVLLMGADCPGLSPQHLVTALEWLAAGEKAVLGPAEDGGYVLMGLSEYAGALFQGLPWGSDQVLGLTRQRLRVLGWGWQELPALWDLDRPADLARLESEFPQLAVTP